MKKNSFWIFLAVVYIFVIGAVVFYRLNKTGKEPLTTAPEPTSQVTPTAQLEELPAQYLVEEASENYQDISLVLLDPSTFESAGYTLELEYDPEVLRIENIEPGDVWSESVVLQKDTSAPGKLIYSVGRQFKAESAGGDTMAKVRFEVLDDSATSTQLKLSQLSKSAGENNIKIIVAEPLIIKLK